MSGTKGKGRTFTEKEFISIKKLLNTDLNLAEIARLVNRSSTLIGEVNKVETWEDYEIRKKSRYIKTPIIEVKQQPTESEQNDKLIAVRELRDAINRLCNLMEDSRQINNQNLFTKLFERD